LSGKKEESLSQQGGDYQWAGHESKGRARKGESYCAGKKTFRLSLSLKRGVAVMGEKKEVSLPIDPDRRGRHHEL